MIKLPKLYELIHGNKKIEEILEWPFDFILVTPTLDTTEYYFKTEEQALCVAEDASGGVFALWGDGDINEREVIYVSSEGQAGKIANNFDYLISLILLCPFWSDLLKFSGQGQISEMRKAYPLLVKEYEEDIPELEESRNYIFSMLPLPKIDDPVKKLYDSVVSQQNITIKSNDGYIFEGLFNSFLVENNPSWR
jgi:hypothetical protein